MSDVYKVHFYADDVRRTHGQCRTDHRVEVGDTIYTQYGRATVRSCRLMREVHMTLVGSTKSYGVKLA